MAIPILGMAAGQILGTGMGMLQGRLNDTRQLEMNRRLQAQQIIGAKDLANYNQHLALDTWEKTNYDAQRKQMEKAGLNVGLMYQQGGPGGTTSGGNMQMPSSSTAPTGGGELGMGMQLGLNALMQQAQIENIKANTQATQVDTKKKLTGTDGEPGTAIGAAELEKIAADTANAKAKHAILQLDKELKDLEREILTGQKENAISLMESAARKAFTEAGITEATAPATIEQVRTAVREQTLRIAAQEKGLIKTDADIASVKQGIAKMATEINNLVQGNQREWDKMTQKDKEIAIEQRIQEAMRENTDFNTSTPQQLKQWTDLIMSILTLGLGGQGGSRPAGFKF